MYQSNVKNVKVDALIRMFDFRSIENDERKRYRKQMLFFSKKFQLCSIDAMNDFFDRVFQTNKFDENCIIYRDALKIEKIFVENVNFQNCTIQNDAFYKNNKLWISNDFDLLLKIVRDVHDQFFCDHFDMNRIEKFIKRYYYWSNMKLIIKRYIRNCHNCQRVKTFHDDRNDLFKFFSIFSQRWIDIFFDFVIELFYFENNNVICTIIDRLSKKRYYVFCETIEKNTSIKICVKILLHYVFRTHDLFSSIISNRNFQFVNVVWKLFCKRLNIKIKLFTTFYSKIDDNIEHVNQKIEMRLRHYCNYIQNDWAKWLNIFEFANNNFQFTIIDMTFFYVNKNYHFRMIFDSNIINYESIRKRLQIRKTQNINDEMKIIFEWSKANVTNVVRRMIVKVNKSRHHVEFEIKNYVWLNRRYIKTIKFFDKLNDKKLKSFQIINKRDQVYELKLSDIMHIHLMFHFWLLRKNFQNSLKNQVNDSLDSIILNEDFEWEINDIVQFKYHRHRFQYRVN